MATFIMALTINPTAKQKNPDLSRVVSESLDVFAEEKVTVDRLFATLGRYDYLTVFDAPDQTVAFLLANKINNKGVLETETWPVIDYDDFSQIIR